MSQNLFSILRWNVEVEEKYIRDGSIIVGIGPANQPNRFFSIANHEHIGEDVMNGDRVLNEIHIRRIVLDENN
jgi:hypothetical protein